MPALTQEPLQKAAPSLFIGLQSYSEAQSDIFYGRDEEIDRLTNLVKSNTLTIVFGKSGTGKTSLLNAGVFPRLRKDYCLPFRIRLEFEDNSPDLVTQIKNILKSEIDKYGFTVEAYPGAETLWEYFHRELLWNSVTPILIFDQFEEIFTLGKKSTHFGANELALFWEELADLIENSIPEKLKDKFLNDKENVGYGYKIQKVKTLFSFREEFLPEFESITAKIPSIKYSRFRLLPMNGNQAYEVITKTWGGAISSAEAKKIVGFFAPENDKKQTFDLMEIEPSLLSQVCSFIDKERRAEGKDNISAEFLDKYPKEKILRSIYNQVLIESNNAIVQNGLEVITAKPVNEFVEEKLITDEGYRTKYSLSEKDHLLRPGIEILVAKYFVRDDGKSVELTHDVLAPLIKRDRENRRKVLALALAKKKANRRALFIILLSVIAALLFWYFATNKARQEKAEAIKARDLAKTKTDSLQLEINHANEALKSLGDSIDANQAKWTRIKNTLRDSSGKDGNPAPSDSLAGQTKYDNNELEALKKQYEDLINQKTKLESNIDLYRNQIVVFKNSQASDSTRYVADRKEIAALQKQIFAVNASLASKQKDYEELMKKHTDYIAQVSRIFNPVDDIDFPHSDTNSLHMDLYYNLTKKNQAKPPKDLKIYLIPDSSYNKAVIRGAMIYEIRCDDLNLDKAKGNRLARYKNGMYSFYDVPPGKYLVKICTYYGGYYPYNKPSAGNKTVKWDVSPPIR